MTYQELVKNYPWIDLAWEAFKGISPTVLALITIFLTEHFVRERNHTYKKREIKLQYLEKILSWTHDTRRKVFEIQDGFYHVLRIKNVEERVTEYNKNEKNITEMNKSVFTWCDTYDDFSKCFGYDFKLEQFREAVNEYSKQITEIMQNYLNGENTEVTVEEMHTTMHRVKEEMQKSISLLVEEINLLYGK